MFFGPYAGKGKMVEGGGGDDMGELREEEIVWGEEMQHNENVPVSYKGNDDNQSHRSMLSMQIEQGFARWPANDSKVGKGCVQQRTHPRIRCEEDDEEEKENEGIMELPPHELLAREYAATTTFSVLQGAGRTLKGMDLRRLRNEVWRQTGFVD